LPPRQAGSHGGGRPLRLRASAPYHHLQPYPGTRFAPFTLRLHLRPRRAAAVTAAAATLREVCAGRVPDHVLQRAEEVGYVVPTEVQEQSLPLLLSGQDCILHAQTGSGKTLAYLLSVFSAIDFGRSSVQALVVVPTRELGIQVTKVARILAAKACTVMALLDGGMLKRQKSWVKAEPPAIIVATVPSLCQMVERRAFNLQSVRVLVIDEVDFIFGSSKQVSSLRKILTSYSAASSRQTIFASASIPQHNRFLHDCVQHKWTKVILTSTKQNFWKFFVLRSRLMFIFAYSILLWCRVMWFMFMSTLYSPCLRTYVTNMW